MAWNYKSIAGNVALDFILCKDGAMKIRKLIYTTTSIICFSFIFIGPFLYKKSQETVVPPKKVALKKTVIKAETLKKVTTAANTVAAKYTSEKQDTPKKHPTKKVLIKNGLSKNIALAKVSFDELPGWDKADVKKSLEAFQLSCANFLKQEPSQTIGSQNIKFKAGDWHPACNAAVVLDSISEESARAFFEKWFHPIEFAQKKPANGLFTGYYMPQIKGELKKSDEFKTPIYGLPKSGGRHKTREQIDNGALKEQAPVIAWIRSPVDRLFMEIEGSGVIKLSNGESIYLGYAGENGAPYTSIAKVLIDRGIMTRDNASKKAITRYLKENPEKANNLIHKNKSFVFFESLDKPMALGAQGMELTPGYSLAVDKKWIPLGAPLWLDTTRPDSRKDNDKQLQRLMIAQDTGGAIRGFMRGDIYWGSGKVATYLGEHMKNEGQYWLLLPKQIFSRLG